MSEASFTLFQNTAVGIEVILYACCLTAFFYPYMAGRKRGHPADIIKMLAVFASYSIIYFFNMAVSMGALVCMASVIVLLTLAAKYLGVEKKTALFMGVVFFCIRNLSSLAVASVNFYTGRHLVKGEEGVERVLRNAALNFCLMELHIRELCYLLLTPVTGILFVNILFRILIVTTGELSIQLYEQYPVLIGIVPVAAVLFYAGILVTIISYQKMVGLQEEKERYFVEQQQVHAIQERMAEVDQFYDGIRRMKHEMKNHLTNIKGLLESGDYGGMGQYISRMDESMDAFE